MAMYWAIIGVSFFSPAIAGLFKGGRGAGGMEKVRTSLGGLLERW